MMDENVKTFPDMIREKIESFKNADPNQKAIALTAFALIISILVVVTIWMNKVNFRVLYSNISMEDASKISKILQEKKIVYKLEDGGSTIMVPAGDVHQLRIDLAGEGLPHKGKMGFELFDKSDFQSTEFEENIKYIRALQGELAQTVNHLDAVKDSKINLSIPRRSIYLNDDAQASASVVLEIFPNRSLSDEEVRGIASLVASSIEGLKVENVTIMTTDGKLLSDFIQDGGYGMSTYQIKVQKQIAKQLEANVRNVLDSVLGPGKAVVNANVEIQMEQKAIQKEMYQPENNNAGIIRSSHILEEKYDGQTERTATAEVTDTETAAQDRIAAIEAGGEGKPPLYNQRSVTTNYEISKVVEQQTVSPGKLSKISVGVLIDSSSKLTPDQLEDLKSVIESVCGIDPTRGDVLTVKMLKFSPITLGEELEEINKIHAMLNKFAPSILPAFSPLAILLLLLIMMKKQKKAETKVMVDNVPSRKSQTVEIEPAGMESGTAGFTQEEIQKMGTAGGKAFPQKSTEELQNTIREFAQKNPQMIANIFEKWVSESE